MSLPASWATTRSLSTRFSNRQKPREKNCGSFRFTRNTRNILRAIRGHHEQHGIGREGELIRGRHIPGEVRGRYSVGPHRHRRHRISLRKASDICQRAPRASASGSSLTSCRMRKPIFGFSDRNFTIARNFSLRIPLSLRAPLLA